MNKNLFSIKDNSIYTTSKCNNHCIMCCQPPKDIDDSNYLFASNLKELKSSLSPDKEIILTGGEPTLIGDKLFNYIEKIHLLYPDTNIHILTNGRNFSNISYLTYFTDNVKHENLTLGIPLHSDNYLDHDKIAGEKGAFYETVLGLQRLSFLRFKIELRIIILKQNYERLEKVAQFIALNLPFVAQVSFMGLEVTGNAVKNFDKIYVDPSHISSSLIKAVNLLAESHIDVKIFNIPLCLLPEKLWHLSCKSISNWKNMYLAECKDCKLINDCCGVFSTSIYHSPNIRNQYAR